MLHPRCRLAQPIPLVIVLILTGCSGNAKITELPQGEKNLRIISRAYTQAAQSLGRSPKNAEEIRPFLKDYGNPDELLVSPNDGKPYGIVPGVNLKNSRSSPVLAYEQEGKNGKRQYIGLGGMDVRTATEEEFTRLLTPSNQKPAAGK